MILTTRYEVIDSCPIDPAEEFYRTLNTGGLEIYYQPVIDILTHGDRLVCASAEALLRLIVDEKVYPAATFIDRFKNYPDVRVALSRFVVSRVLADLGRISERNFQVRVNLFAEDLTFAPFIEWLLMAIEGEQERIILEVGEASAINDGYADALFLVRKAGARFSLDDWGQESSNVCRLFLRPDEIKIDKFLCPNNYTSDALKGCLICVFAAQMFNCEIVLEGIETKEQLAIARALGINYGQGFLWSKAVPLERFIRDFL